MYNELGRHIAGKHDETGRFDGVSVTETGRRVFGFDRITASLCHALDTVDPISAGLAATLDLSGQMSAVMSAPIVSYFISALGYNQLVMNDYITAGLTVPLAAVPDYCSGSLAAPVVISTVLIGAQTATLSTYSQATCGVVMDCQQPIVTGNSSPLVIMPDYHVASQSATMANLPPKLATMAAPLGAGAPIIAAQAVRVALISPLTATASALLEVMEKNIVTASQSAPMDAGLQSVIMPAPTAALSIAGVNVYDLIETAEIRQERRSAHADFSFTSNSPELFHAINPTDAVVITVNGVARQFVLEEVSMTGEISFRGWGRSASCLLDSPHHDSVTVEVDGSLTAAGLAASISDGLCSWTALDYPLPIGWSMTGTPVEIIIRLAATVGALVQPSGNGLAVVPGFSVRPVDWQISTPVASYLRETNILSLSWDDEAATPWNSVTVSGWSESWQAPQLELEESSPRPGADVHVRVYRKGTGEGVFANLVTDGTVQRVTDGSLTITREIVQFSDYQGSVKYPIDELVEFSWVGDTRGEIYWLQGGRSSDLELAPGSYPDLEGCGIALVTYRTSYERYRLSGHNVAELMMICTQPDSGVARLKVLVNGLDSPEAPLIAEELATTEAAAVAAGTAWLDANRYNRRNINLSAPHDATASPGALVSLADEIEDVSGTAMIESRTIAMNGPAVIDSLEVFQCLS